MWANKGKVNYNLWSSIFVIRMSITEAATGGILCKKLLLKISE